MVGLAYRPDAANEIVQRVAEGETLTKVCKSLGLDVPSVWRWTRKHSEFNQDLRDARELSAHASADKAQDILEQPIPDELYSVQGAANAEISRRREIAQHLRWKASKAMPQVYSDRQQLDITARTVSLVDVLTTIGVSGAQVVDARADAATQVNSSARLVGSDLIPRTNAIDTEADTPSAIKPE